jgi:D-3-phosphoglycerate dehydrogenase
MGRPPGRETEESIMKILIADKFEQAGLDALDALGCEVTFSPDLTTDDLPGALGDTKPEVLIVRSTKVPADVLQAGPTLKVIIRAGAGYDTIDTDAAGRYGMAVCNCPGMNSAAVAELAMGFILAFDRRIPQQTQALREGKWAKKAWAKLGRGLKGRTLGLIGTGQIGRLVAKRALAFDMKVLYHDIIPCDELDNLDGVQRTDMDDVLRSSDYVSLHVPSNEHTKHLINESNLKLMPPTAVLINTTRGAVVDQVALTQALKDGTIAGACLDVYENEPGAEDKAIDAEILNLPNFIGTHHVGASTEQAQLAVGEEAVRIVQVYKETGDAINCVNSDALAAATA